VSRVGKKSLTPVQIGARLVGHRDPSLARRAAQNLKRVWAVRLSTPNAAPALGRHGALGRARPPTPHPGGNRALRGLLVVALAIVNV
jgi:hypothetical protein